MNGNELGKEIRNGMNAMGGGFKLAGKIRNAQLVAKQGYVGLVNPAAVAAFHANPDYIDWTCQFVDGEYRFFPPKEKIAELLDLLNKNNKSGGKTPPATESKESEKNQSETLDTKGIVDTYKKITTDLDKVAFVSITVLRDDPKKCRYALMTTNKRTGEQEIVQEFTTEFEGKFSMELIPSIYNQLMGGLPVIGNEKGTENHRAISFQSVEDGRIMAFGNLQDSQLELIKSMKKFVDSEYFGAEVKPEKNITK